ncbi:hypothetical protein DCS_01139 [Drechmeria coniospora]|uniref:non-specific serine/threonine protein kinase n=1 Tax=Drechmeria coniospora TaxID=98403 RepID=A0A151GSD0_DRECN|nr:hypothetical protein DCS_01139 [Drechmeria coniospora]KYK60005.1 hypothetical protein DCS_01139 [Drechmeria coniospora]ODA78804.1 hypothetical protein RJ55_06188 [Drechmeria coniospora]
MPRTIATRNYGKSSKRTKAERLFAQLPQSPIRTATAASSTMDDDPVKCITQQLATIRIEEKTEERDGVRKSPRKKAKAAPLVVDDRNIASGKWEEAKGDFIRRRSVDAIPNPPPLDEPTIESHRSTPIRTLSWDDVCPPGDRIVKIAEASYAEVYRVTNERGTSIIKVIRLESPIKPKTKAQIKSGLVDEEPHAEDGLNGELQISEWLADIPGFVVYKEKYVVQGKTSRQLLETHQAFQKRMKRQDPGRAQFYPSPSRYLDETKFLVVELGDAGVALEDWPLTDETELWDIFLLEAVALARAEEMAMFEHRDLHEGNLCVKRVGPRREAGWEADGGTAGFFGYSGLDITILDYGLSRAEDVSVDDATPVALDLERDLGLFTSTHASQCNVYRQMRSFLLRADRRCIPPEGHKTPYARGVDGPISWDAYAPYTNVLWLAYLFAYLVDNFQGGRKQLARFRRKTSEMWSYLDPEADDDVPCFGSAADVVCFAVESGWLRQEQLLGVGSSMLDREDSIIVSREEGDGRVSLRRSSRKREE